MSLLKRLEREEAARTTTTRAVRSTTTAKATPSARTTITARACRADDDPDVQRLKTIWEKTYGTMDGFEPFLMKFKHNPQISFTEFVQKYVMATAVFGSPFTELPDPTRRADNDPDVTRLQQLWVQLYGSEAGFEPFLRKFQDNPGVTFSQFVKQYILGTTTLPTR